MLTHAVNKQVFDFTCGNESVAKAIRHEFLHFTSVELNKLLNDVLTAHDSKEDNLLIDRIEIDLGELKQEDFGNGEMLLVFASLLSEQILTSQRKIGVNFSSDDIFTESGNEELLESLFLRGDLPWWLDKAVETNPAKLLRSIYESKPEAVRLFFERNMQNQAVLTRLRSQYSPAGKAIFEKFFGIELFPKTGVLSVPHESEIRSSFNDWLTHLQTREVLDSITSKLSNGNKEKQLLIRKLLRSKHPKSLSSLTKFNLFSNASASEISIVVADVSLSSPLARKSLAEILMPLSIVQLKFIDWWISNEISTDAIAKENEHSSVLDGQSDEFSKDEGILLSAATQQKREVSALPADYPNATLADTRGRSLDMSGPGEETKRADERSKAFADLKPGEDTQVDKKPGDLTTLIGTTSAETNSALSDLSLSDKTISERNNFPASSRSADPTVSQRGLNDISSEPLHGLTNPIAEDNRFPEEQTLSAGRASTMDASTDFRNQSATRPGEKGFSHPDEINSSETPEINRSNARDLISPKAIELAGELLKMLENKNQYLFAYLLQLPEEQQKQISRILSGDKEKFSRKRKIVNNLLNESVLSEFRLALLLATATLPSQKQLNEVPGNGFERLDESPELSKIAGNGHKQSAESPEFSKAPRNGYLQSDDSPELNEVPGKSDEQSAKTFELMLLTAQNNVKIVLGKLSPKELFVLQDIFKKPGNSTTNEKALIKRFLLQLETETIQLLDALAAKADDKFLQQALASENTLDPRQLNEFTHSTAEENDNQHKIYVANGGLCLIAPYLNGLFTNLGYLENSVFKNKAIQTRAFYLLQYIATGKTAAPEFVLQLNKLLCGAQPQEALGISIRLTKKEKSEAEELIGSVIANWKALKNTSVQGFRESFLQRKGIITENELSLTLQVERLGHDLLLDTIPWGFKLIKLTWMKKMLQVEW